MSRQGEWQSIGIGGAPYSLHVWENRAMEACIQKHTGAAMPQRSRVCIYLIETSRGKAWIDPEEEVDA